MDTVLVDDDDDYKQENMGEVKNKKKQQKISLYIV